LFKLPHFALYLKSLRPEISELLGMTEFDWGHIKQTYAKACRTAARKKAILEVWVENGMKDKSVTDIREQMERYESSMKPEEED
jgi:hypothetical protein